MQDLLDMKDLTIQGVLLVGLILVYRDARTREKLLKEETDARIEKLELKLIKKDDVLFSVLDKTAQVLDRIEELDANNSQKNKKALYYRKD